MMMHTGIVLKNARTKIYIACEELDMVWDEKDVIKFDRMWNQGLGIKDISCALNRNLDEVGLLIIDRANKGIIERRNGGVQGKRLSVL